MPEMIAPKVLSFATSLDEKTRDQAAQTASMPFVHSHVALMPDAHVGMGSAVGTVIPTLNAVIPAAVGVDIGCGMIAAETVLTAADIADLDLKSLRMSVESAIPLSPGVYNRSVDRYDFTRARLDELSALAQERGVDLSHSPTWQRQLGSLGGGNHFIELCLDERDRVWLFLHSGSRGVGNKIAQRHIKIAQQLCKRWWIDLPSPELTVEKLAEAAHNTRNHRYSASRGIPKLREAAAGYYRQFPGEKEDETVLEFRPLIQNLDHDLADAIGEVFATHLRAFPDPDLKKLKGLARQYEAQMRGESDTGPEIRIEPDREHDLSLDL